jgi:protein O-GlcNAc transferase
MSRFFRNHTIGELLGGFITHLARDAFEVTVFSPVRYEDATGRSIRENADRYLELPPTVPAARHLVAQQGLDVLFYTDIGMEPISYALAFSRLAPIQCTTWGHPVTTGLPTMDYYISSALFETDDADEHYTEKLVRLKSLPFCCPRPAVPATFKSRLELNLPADAHLYASLQSLFKMHPEFDALLGAILRGDPRGLVLLPQAPGRAWQQLLEQRFANTIPDVAERIRFIPRVDAKDFLHLNAAVDVLLDPIHFNGGHTTLLALAVGTPIVTMPSRFLPGRMTQAIYRRMGVFDCITRTPEEYAARAIRVGTDPEYRAALRARILSAHDVLYDNLEPVRELEGFFTEVVASGQ